MPTLKKNALRLPDKLVCTALRFAVAGTLACSTSASSQPGTDASGTDAPLDAIDSPVNTMDVTALDTSVNDVGAQDTQTNDGSVTDAATDGVTMMDVAILDAPMDSSSLDGCVLYCGPTGTVDGAVCPGLICDLSQCPLDSGCEPFA